MRAFDACACPEDPAPPDGLTGLESSRFCQSAELTEASSERGEGVRRCPRPSSSCRSSEFRVDSDCARADDVRDSEDLDVDREPGTWQKISRNATRAQHPPPRGGARLPIEAHAAFFSAIFSIVHLLLVLLAGRVHDEERVEVQSDDVQGGNPAFLDDQSRNGPLESEILESRSRSRSRLIEAQIPAISPIPAKSGFPDFPGSRPNRDRGKIPSIFPIPAQSGSRNPGYFPGQIGGQGGDSGISGSGSGGRRFQA